MSGPSGLPVEDALPDLLAALDVSGIGVLVAPPGAGKTTQVPLALLDAPWRGDDTILVVGPRRLAARAAARRMASLRGEEPGQTVGYAMRMDSRSSAVTRILVVTEGVAARMILDDPELPGIAAILFDEFHERSLDGDFALALALDIREALRPDLRLLAMSATIDGARVASLMGNAPVVESLGRIFPVTLRYMERAAGVPVEDAVAAAILGALRDEEGSVLAFVPGQREIERTAERLDGRVGADVDVLPLFGQMEGRAQDAAIRPAPPGRRKVVLATSIAETSITIDGVRVVVDSGLSRRPVYEPATGLTRLETVRVSRASADQRAGRAGRTAPGVAIRLWREAQTAALDAFDPPQILQADLSGLLLDCAAFGVSDPTALRFLDAPPAAALAEARSLLTILGAIDAEGRLTPVGQAMRRLALPVRLAHMVAAATGDDAVIAAELAVLLTERGLGGTSVDLDHRLERFRSDRSPRAVAAKGLARRLAETARDLARTTSYRRITSSAGALLLHAYPDRVARARGAPGRYVLANGRGAILSETDPLTRSDWLVVADLQGKAQNARIAAAAAIDEAEIRATLGADIKKGMEAGFDRARGAIRVRETERLGAILIAERMLPAPRGAAADAAILDAVRREGVGILPFPQAAALLRDRLRWLRTGLGEPWPDMADAALAETAEAWLGPFLAGHSDIAQIAPVLHDALLSTVPYDLQRRIGDLAPTHFDAPSGSRVPIRYDGEAPVLAIRVQELFGLDSHPAIAGGTVPLTLEMLSPAHRPIQTTRDLPGFWRGSWADVRADMRGRYPKHVWPEDPVQAVATSRAKPSVK